MLGLAPICLLVLLCTLARAAVLDLDWARSDKLYINIPWLPCKFTDSKKVQNVVLSCSRKIAVTKKKHEQGFIKFMSLKI